PGASPGATGGESPAAGGERNASAAVETALAAVDGSMAFELSFNRSRGEWEVELVSADTEHEVRVSADGSEVLEEHTSGAVDAEDRTELQGARVPLAEAITTAQEEADGEVQEASLEDENGKAVWEIEIRPEGGQETEVLIDAATGEPVR
ncbi:putative lipoprotein, partial [Arthrobacter crystallopoietes BAB-32]